MTTTPNADAHARVADFLAACRDRRDDNIQTVATAASGHRDVTLSLADLRIVFDDKRDDHDIGLAAARARAGWELGDPSWADTLIAAYRDPHTDAARLRDQMTDR